MRAQLHVHIVKFIFVSTMSVSVFKSRGSSFEQILEKKILNFIIIMKNRKNFRFSSGSGKALPALSWTYKCECRLEI